MSSLILHSPISYPFSFLSHLSPFFHHSTTLPIFSSTMLEYFSLPCLFAVTVMESILPLECLVMRFQCLQCRQSQDWSAVLWSAVSCRPFGSNASSFCNVWFDCLPGRTARRILYIAEGPVSAYRGFFFLFFSFLFFSFLLLLLYSSSPFFFSFLLLFKYRFEDVHIQTAIALVYLRQGSAATIFWVATSKS